MQFLKQLVWVSFFLMVNLDGLVMQQMQLSIHFDDGVFIDKDKQRADEMQLVAAGIMPKFEYLKRNFGLSEEDAQKWLAQVNNEQPDFSQGVFQEPIDGDSNEVQSMDSKQKLDQDTNNIANLYSNLEDKIFSEIIKVLQRGHYEDVTQDNVVQWQAQQLSQIGALTKRVIDLMADFDGISPSEIETILKQDGYEILDEVS